MTTSTGLPPQGLTDPHQAVLPALKGRHPSPLRVLVVDDMATNRLQLCAVLSPWGIAPDIAHNGVEAVKLAWEQAYDLLLMDLDMPEMGGFEAARLIRQMERVRPFRTPLTMLAYSSEDISEADANFIQSGMNGVLSKPCDAAQMLRSLEKWFAGRFEAIN